MRRREFIKVVAGSAATAWPLAVRAQQSDRVRRIGLLTPLAESDPEGQARLDALRQGLEKLGWIEGRNFEIDYHGRTKTPTTCGPPRRNLWDTRQTSSWSTAR